MTVHPKDGKPFDLKLQHTFNEPQITWFKAGSALNGEKPLPFPFRSRHLLTIPPAMAKAHKSS